MTRPFHTRIETAAGAVCLTEDGFALSQDLQQTILQFWKKRGYRGADGMQSLNALLIATAPLIAALPKTERATMLTATLLHLVELVKIAEKSVQPGEILEDGQSFKLN